MNKYEEILNFKRKYTIDSLYNIDSFLLNSKYVEFKSMDSFFLFLRSFPRVNKDINIVLPVNDPRDLKRVYQINKRVFKSIYVYLKDFSNKTIKILELMDNKDSYYKIIIDSCNIEKFKEQLTPEVYNLLSISTCIYRDELNNQNYKNLIYLFQDPFFKLPYFNNSEIYYNWESLSKLNFIEVKTLMHQYRFYINNLYKSGSACINGEFKKYKEYYGSSFFKEIMVDEEGFSIKNAPETYIKFDDLNSRNININRARSAYDVKYPKGMKIDNNLLSIDQNKKCSESYMVPPELYNILFTIREENGLYD